MKAIAIVYISGLLLLPSCSLFGVGREEPISPDEQYLPTGGTTIDAGPDQSNLVETLSQAQEQVRTLQAKIGQLTSENEKLGSELQAAKGTIARTKEAQTRSAHDTAELTESVRQLKTKILMLQIENAQLEQAKILMRLAALRSQHDAINAGQANAMPMSGAHR